MVGDRAGPAADVAGLKLDVPWSAANQAHGSCSCWSTPTASRSGASATAEACASTGRSRSAGRPGCRPAATSTSPSPSTCRRSRSRPAATPGSCCIDGETQRGLAAAVPGARRPVSETARLCATWSRCSTGSTTRGGPRRGTPSGWSPATPTSRCDGCCSRSTPSPAVIDEAVAWGADLLVTHHPLLLRGVHGVADDRRQGPCRDRAGARRHRAARRAHQRRRRRPRRLRRARRRARARSTLRPLRPAAPAGDARQGRDVRPARGRRPRGRRAGRGRRRDGIGDYARCAWTTEGTGTFRPLPGRAARRRRGRRAPRRCRRPGSRWCCRRDASYRRRSPRCGPRTRTRSRRTTCSSSRAGSRRPRHSAGSAELPAPVTLRRVRRAGRARRCRRPPHRCRGRRRPRPRGAHASRSAAAPATTCSTTCGPPAPTSTSPPTCATTPRRRRWSTARPALVDCRALGHRVAVAGRRGAAVARRPGRVEGLRCETRVSTLVTDPWTSTVSTADPRSQR